MITNILAAIAKNEPRQPGLRRLFISLKVELFFLYDSRHSEVISKSFKSRITEIALETVSFNRLFYRSNLYDFAHHLQH